MNGPKEMTLESPTGRLYKWGEGKEHKEFIVQTTEAGMKDEGL